MDLNKNINDIVTKGLREIDNEVTKKDNIREQANIVIRDLLSNNYRSKIELNGNLYLLLLSTGNKLVKDNNGDIDKVGTYALTVYDIRKVYNIQKGNNDLLVAFNKAKAIDNIDDESVLNISPKTYKPFVFEVEIEDGFEVEQLLNTLVSSAIAYLSGELIVEELPY